MISCTSSNKFTKGKSQRLPQNLDNSKMDGHWNVVEHPFRSCLPGTELLQSPFMTEFRWDHICDDVVDPCGIIADPCCPYWNCHGTVRAMTFGAYVHNFGDLICS